MKKYTLEELYKRVVPLLRAQGMLIEAKGRDGQRIEFYTYFSDEPGPSRGIRYSRPCKEGRITMDGHAYLTNAEEIDAEWDAAKLHQAEHKVKYVDLVEIDWQDRSWSIDQNMLKNAYSKLKDALALFQGVCADAKNLITENGGNQ